MHKYIWGFDGKKWSEAEMIRFQYGERLRINMINDTMMSHPRTSLHACVLRVNHTEGATIRIDSLHVHEPTAQEALRSKRSLSNKAQQAFGRHALQGVHTNLS